MAPKRALHLVVLVQKVQGYAARALTLAAALQQFLLENHTDEATNPGDARPHLPSQAPSPETVKNRRSGSVVGNCALISHRANSRRRLCASPIASRIEKHGARQVRGLVVCLLATRAQVK